eukprot:jgi/Botrbrau1/11020/Bobra.101_1s0018.1
MIYFTKNWYSLVILFRLNGSAIPRALPWAILSAGITFVAHTYYPDYTQEVWKAASFPYSIFSYIFGFIIVFRSNSGYERYRSGRISLAKMTAAWADACAQAIAFDSDTLPATPSESELEAARLFREAMVHLISLLHGVALQHLRIDWDLGNLTRHQSYSLPPPLDGYALLRQGISWPFRICYDASLRSRELQRGMYNRCMKISVVGGLLEAEQEALGGPHLFGRSLSLTVDRSGLPRSFSAVTGGCGRRSPARRPVHQLPPSAHGGSHGSHEPRGLHPSRS